MKRICLSVLAYVMLLSANAQTADPLQSKTLSLNDRYFLMKKQAETYQEYKVIKENVLDAVWKTSIDTLKKREQELKAAGDKIKSLKNQADSIQALLKSKTDSMAGITFASTHINVLGLNFHKVAFLSFSALALMGFGSIILFLLGRIKLMQISVKENKLIAVSCENELREFKRNTVEREVKLSRELQTERNKLIELKESLKVKR